MLEETYEKNNLLKDIRIFLFLYILFVFSCSTVVFPDDVCPRW